MSVWLIEKGNAPVLETTVKDGLSGAAIVDATVTVVMVDSSGAQVSGVTWPFPLTYVAASAGIYRAQLPDALAVVAGQSYKGIVEVSAPGADDRTLIYDIVVTEPGSGETVPASSTASPAYQAPATLTLLRDAEAAYHRLLLGLSPRVVVDQNGERVEYTAANRASLQQYIQSLKQALGLVSAANSGPARVYF